MLQLGLCATPPGPGNSEIFPAAKLGYENHYVWDNKLGGTACTYGYAITWEAARGLLGFLQDTSLPTDLQIARFCTASEADVDVEDEAEGNADAEREPLREMGRRSRRARQNNCLVVWPMLISSHKPAGPVNRDTDIGHSQDEEFETREKGESWKIVDSAILDALDRTQLGPLLSSEETRSQGEDLMAMMEEVVEEEKEREKDGMV